VANGLLDHDAKETPITGVVAGVVFAFVSGLAGTFTACNVAAFGAVAPMLGTSGGRWSRFVGALRPVAWLSVGMIGVSAVYGVLVGLVGTSMPQFDTAQSVPGTLSARGVQSLVASSLIVAGAFNFLYWGVRMLARRELIPWYPVAPWG
jgi:hypothetical protein